MSLVEHLKHDIFSHVAAGTGTIFSFLNGAAIMQSILVGVAIYVITHGLSYLAKKVLKK